MALRGAVGSSMQIICLNAGNFAGRGLRYAANLHRQASVHLALPHQFVCFTDDEEPYPDGIVTRPLPHPGLKGWMNKLALFKPGVFPDDERVVYLDLDTFIVDPIDFLGAYDGRFAMLGPFFDNVNPLYAGPQSGVMAWRGGFGAEIWEPFVKAGFPDTRGGDQRFINDIFHPKWLSPGYETLSGKPDLLQELFPGKFASYKGACMEAVPEGVAVVCFHGLPRCHQAGGWARQLWREGAIEDRTR